MRIDEPRHVYRPCRTCATRTSVSKSTSVMSFGLGQILEESDRRGGGQSHVFEHAAAFVEQQPQTQFERFALGVAAHEDTEVLPLAVLVDLEVAGREIGDEVSLAVQHHHGHVHEVDAPLEPPLLRRDGGRRNDRNRPAEKPRPHVATSRW